MRDQGIRSHLTTGKFHSTGKLQEGIMPESPQPRRSFWSWPQDSFVQGLRDPEARARQLQSLKFRRWINLGLILAGIGLLLFSSSKSTERDNLWHILILISLFWLDQDTRCKQHIAELAGLLDNQKREK